MDVKLQLTLSKDVNKSEDPPLEGNEVSMLSLIIDETAEPSEVKFVSETVSLCHRLVQPGKIWTKSKDSSKLLRLATAVTVPRNTTNQVFI